LYCSRGEKRDARERVSPSPRRNSRSPGWAAPLPNVLLSLGYPATNSPRGKAQAGDSPRLHQKIYWGIGLKSITTPRPDLKGAG